MNLPGMESRGAESNSTQVTFTCGAEGKIQRTHHCCSCGAWGECPVLKDANGQAMMLVRMKTSPRQEMQDWSTQLTSLGTRRVTSFTGFMTFSASHVFSPSPINQ